MKNLPVAHVVFDCDGVLVDSEPLSIEVDRQVLAEIGWNLSADEIAERFVGRTHQHFLEEVARHLGHPPPPGWDDENTPRYRAAYAEALQPVDGIIEALERIQLPSCVASSGTHDKVVFSLRITGLLGRFEGRIFSATDVERGKPAPDLFLHAAKTLGWDPSLCVVVEDSPYGVEAALAAGMRAVAYAGGVTRAGQLARQGVIVIDRMRDLPDAIAALYATSGGSAICEPPRSRPGDIPVRIAKKRTLRLSSSAAGNRKEVLCVAVPCVIEPWCS